MIYMQTDKLLYYIDMIYTFFIHLTATFSRLELLQSSTLNEFEVKGHSINHQSSLA